MFYRLISPDGTQSFDLKLHAPLIVGRAPTCDLSVSDPTISRRHAELVVDDDQVTLRDLGSSNGTFVLPQGQRLAARRETLVAPGQQVRLGRDSVFRLDAAEDTGTFIRR